MWDYLIKGEELSEEGKEIVFRSKKPKRYIQIKKAYIEPGNSNQLIAIFSDITRIMEVES